MNVGDLVLWDFEGIPAAKGDIGLVVHVYTAASDPADTSVDVMWEDGEFCMQLAGDVKVVSEGR